MAIALNAVEVFEVAEQIERNGSQFYRRASEMFDDSDICKVFLELSEWELLHEKVLRDMREQLVESGTEPQTFVRERNELDPRLIACLDGFGTVAEPLVKLKRISTVTDVLRTAIEKEQDTVAFYEGLKDFVGSACDQKKVDEIISEEIHHIRILGQALQQRE
jgi:rubrerythrin